MQLIQDAPKLLDDSGDVPNQREWLAIRFLAVKSSLYLMGNLPGDQAPLLFQKKKTNHLGVMYFFHNVLNV